MNCRETRPNGITKLFAEITKAGWSHGSPIKVIEIPADQLDKYFPPEMRAKLEADKPWTNNWMNDSFSNADKDLPEVTMQSNLANVKKYYFTVDGAHRSVHARTSACAPLHAHAHRG